jgi:hypothetical protein
MLIGMNRLRNAYVALDPEVEQYLVTSRYDDAAGLMASYLMGTRRSMFSHVMGSTANAIVAGTLGALVVEAAGAPAWLIALIGALAGLSFVNAAVLVGRRRFDGDVHESRFPTPEG